MQENGYSDNVILLIDDDSLFRKLLIKKLTYLLGAYVVEANDPIEAEKYLQNNHPDLIILDILMPVIDGLSWLKKVRKEKKYGDIRVIPCTTMPTRELVVNMIKLKIDDFFDKSTKMDVLLAKVQKSLDKINEKKQEDI